MLNTFAYVEFKNKYLYKLKKKLQETEMSFECPTWILDSIIFFIMFYFSICFISVLVFLLKYNIYYSISYLSISLKNKLRIPRTLKSSYFFWKLSHGRVQLLDFENCIFYIKDNFVAYISVEFSIKHPYEISAQTNEDQYAASNVKYRLLFNTRCRSFSIANHKKNSCAL